MHHKLSFVCCYTHTEASPELQADHMNQKSLLSFWGVADVRLNGRNYIILTFYVEQRAADQQPPLVHISSIPLR